MLELDANTVSGGHDGCIWPPFPVTALSGRRAKFDLWPPPPCTTRLAFLNLLLGPTKLLSARLEGEVHFRVFLVCLTPRCSCHAAVRTNLVIRRCLYGPGILGVSNHAFRAWIEAQPNLMRCNPERRNVREAGWAW